MRVFLKNFSSYETLEFDFSNQGLTLIQGPTGAGKSTLCDAIPWILFGRTAKGGSVDEVLRWPGDKITEGGVILNDRGIEWIVCRRRGPKAKDNDLYYEDSANGKIRGKDLIDTQKMINEVLGFSYETYLSASYFHEFSETAQFFNTTPKNRRAICEQLVDLSLAKKIQEGVKEEIKENTHLYNEKDKKINYLQANIFTLEQIKEASDKASIQWVKNKEIKKQSLLSKSNTFEIDTSSKKEGFMKEIEFSTSYLILKGVLDKEEEKLNAQLKKSESKVCEECGAFKDSDKRDDVKQALHRLHIDRLSNKSLESKIEALNKGLQQTLNEKNTYLEQIADLDKEENPYLNPQIKEKIERQKREVLSLKSELQKDTTYTEDLKCLLEVSSSFRSVLVSNTIESLQSSTNLLLEDYFDGEIRVEFDVTAEDKLEVLIYKNAYLCSYTQLSKGQRQLLKLCFNTSVMECVNNHSQVSFENIFLDEAFDGLDENMKRKVFRLLTSLTLKYKSIFVVEHSQELKSLFDNQFEVGLIDGRKSVISKKDSN